MAEGHYEHPGQPHPMSGRRPGSGQITITAKRRKEPDVDKIVAALLRILEQENQQKQPAQKKAA